MRTLKRCSNWHGALSAAENTTIKKVVLSMDKEKTTIQNIVDTSINIDVFEQTAQNGADAASVLAVQSDEKPEKRSAKKFRYMAFIVYPDNPAQMAAFKWFREFAASNGLISGGMYIHHKGEKAPETEEDKKDHIHVMFYRDVQLSGSWVGFANKGRYRIAAAASWFGTYDICVDGDTRYYKGFSEGLPDGLTWETKQVISEVQGVQDPTAYAIYMCHKRYCDRHKIQYDWDDLKYFGASERFRALFDSEDERSSDIDYELREIIKQYDICVGEGSRLVDVIISLARRDLLDYVRKHGQYINFYLLNPRKG